MKSITTMTGIEKAAALLISLGPDVASEILRHLDGESIRRISEQIAMIDSITSGDKEELIGEFLLDLKKRRGSLYGGENVAKEILVGALGDEKAHDVLSKLNRQDLERGFDFLKDIETDVLVSFLQNEHPQTVAVTLAYLPPAKSAEILKLMDSGVAREVAKRLAKMEKTSPEAVLEIARVIRKRYEESKAAGRQHEVVGGVDTLVSIMNHMSGDQEKGLMEFFDSAMPSVARDIREKLFVFENVLNLTNQEIRVLIDEINDDELIARALKGAGDEVRFKLLRNMSQNRASDIIKDMERMGPTRLSDIQSARDEIVGIMRALNDNGVIDLRKQMDQYVE
ncbi:MAG TPA: flagellar motor switch protein FliG [Spirochaetota bacterium]|nr:flagellar motor switch protein FliG [Spirochaetota bacterium]HNT11025.1 flagellar motor switch protein FliG [Spirochaetota bacterium]HNV48136.1 flagellar motor switch protein FliG [Spirochaetota bacterium]HOS40476.1 flagellar motor switch protein FliG [Spirochaetota bacterium]HPU90405.1 flagellar motor switch protein FliG [Spirochaetota bacterium]